MIFWEVIKVTEKIGLMDLHAVSKYETCILINKINILASSFYFAQESMNKIKL